MKNLILTLTLASAALFAVDTKPPEILSDSPNPQRYLYGATRIPGSVKLKLTVDESGKLSSVKVLEGRPELAASAIRMVHDYKFAPATAGNHNVRAELDVEFHFRFRAD